MSIIKAELNVKRNSTDYDQLHLTSEAGLTSYTNGTITELTSVENALNYILDGKHVVLTGQDILAYLVSSQKDNTNITIRGYDNPNPPTGQSTTSNDLYYISFRQSSTYISVIAFDARANNIYSNVRNNGTWTGWNNIRNASSFDGIARTGFMQNYPLGSGITITDSNYKQPYVADIEGAKAVTIGLPNAWWHLMYLPHANSNGNGCQIAYPFDTTQKPKYRTSTGTTWQDWKSMGGGGATISASAPTDTEALWIDSTGLMRYYNGSAWVVVKTNAVWA